MLMSSDAASVRRRDGCVIRGYETVARQVVLPLYQAVRGTQVQVDNRSLEGQGLDLAGKKLVARHLDRAECLERPRP